MDLFTPYSDILKYNPNHDARGRFTTGLGGAKDATSKKVRAARRAVKESVSKTRQAIVDLKKRPDNADTQKMAQQRVDELNAQLRRQSKGVWYDAGFADYVWRNLSDAFIKGGFNTVGESSFGRAVATVGLGLYMAMRYVYRQLVTAGTYGGVKYTEAGATAARYIQEAWSNKYWLMRTMLRGAHA